jgi:hypothetical protein
MAAFEKIRLSGSKTIFFRLSTKKRNLYPKMSEMRLAGKSGDRYNV